MIFCDSKQHDVTGSLGHCISFPPLLYVVMGCEASLNPQQQQHKVVLLCSSHAVPLPPLHHALPLPSA